MSIKTVFKSEKTRKIAIGLLFLVLIFAFVGKAESREKGRIVEGEKNKNLVAESSGKNQSEVQANPVSADEQNGLGESQKNDNQLVNSGSNKNPDASKQIRVATTTAPAPKKQPAPAPKKQFNKSAPALEPDCESSGQVQPLSQAQSSNQVQSSGQVQEIANLINSERSKAGLSSVTLNAKLNSAASAKSKDMLDNNYFAHTSPSGVSDITFVTQAGYKYGNVGINIAKGDFGSSAGLVQAWMNSAGHKANILASFGQEIGIGVSGNYFTMIIAKPM